MWKLLIMRRMRGVFCDAMRQLNFYFDCVYVDLFVINITQRLLQSVHCKVACCESSFAVSSTHRADTAQSSPAPGEPGSRRAGGNNTQWDQHSAGEYLACSKRCSYQWMLKPLIKHSMIVSYHSYLPVCFPVIEPSRGRHGCRHPVADSAALAGLGWVSPVPACL